MAQLKNNTIKTYERSLIKLQNLGIDIQNFTIKKLENIFKRNNIPLNTQNIYINALLWYCNKNNVDDTDKLEELKKKIHTIQYETNRQYLTNELNIKEKEKYIPWEIVLKIYSKLDKDREIFDDPRLEVDYLLLSLYVYHAPRRTDYADMYYDDVKIPRDKKRILWTNKDSINKYGNDYKIKNFNEKISLGHKNYYVRQRDRSYFVFENYKTMGTYGRQVIEVNNKLDEIIKKYIKDNKIKKGGKLLDLNNNDISRRLTAIFNRYINKNISVDMLRHIYVSYMYDTEKLKNEKEKFILANKMGHSIDTQSLYKKIVNSNETDGEIKLNKNYDIKKMPQKAENRPEHYQKHETIEEKEEAKRKSRREWYEKNKEKVAAKRRKTA